MVVTLSLEGQPTPGLELRGSAHPAHAPQQVQLLLQYGGLVLERIALNPTHHHLNRAPGVPRIRLPPGHPRHYTLASDPRWPPPKGGPEIAQLIVEPLDNVEALTRYCLRAWAIAGALPAPPYYPELIP